jgi:hypothetical protein
MLFELSLEPTKMAGAQDPPQPPTPTEFAAVKLN